MAFAFDDISCGGQLQVGAGVVPAIGVGDNKINGSAHIAVSYTHLTLPTILLV